MAKIEIDNKRMWESILGFQLEGEEAKKFNDLCKYKPFKAALAFFSKAFKHALKDQGLCYKDGEITTIEPKVEWYMCIKESAGFKAGHIYKCNGGRFVNDLGVMFTAGYWGDYFRPATEEEVMKYSYKDKPNYPLMPSECTTIEPEPKKCLYTKEDYTDEERKELCDGCQEECELNKDIKPKERKVSGVLKKMLDNLDEERLAKTREEMLEETELTDFEKVLAECIHRAQDSVLSPEGVAITWSDALMAEARKQIASEIDATQMTREMRIKDLYSLTLGAAYYQGIVNTIKKIKGESI